MDAQQKEWIIRYQPRIYRDRNDPFPIRYLGCTVFTRKERSSSFPKWVIDPAGEGAQAIIEYAIYYDYDIQHLYDLEHIWVAVGEDGGVKDCWGSFHGMRLRAAGVRAFRVDGTHPVLYAQPGKHAMMPEPELFELLPKMRQTCNLGAGGGLLIPGFLQGRMETNAAQDEKIRMYLVDHFSFVPSMEFEPETLEPEQFLSWPELLERIPQLVARQIQIIEAS